MSTIRRDAEGARIWTCAVCGRTGTWGRGWARYGSIALDEECGHDVPTCSEQCRQTDRAAALVLAFERDHPRYSRCKAGAR